MKVSAKTGFIQRFGHKKGFIFFMGFPRRFLARAQALAVLVTRHL
jgi:hypothetical protein